MKAPRPLLASLFVFASTGIACAASIATGPLETNFSGAAASVNTTAAVTRNLSNLTGLTPGQSIQVEFAQSNPVAWEGQIFYPDGELTITWQATVEINIDGQIFTYTDTWTLGPSIVPESGPTGVFGNQVGSTQLPHSFVVPWGTDLSDVTVTLRDLSSMSNGYFAQSSMSLSGTLTTTSVPEPSAMILFAIAFPAATFVRRRPRVLG